MEASSDLSKPKDTDPNNTILQAASVGADGKEREEDSIAEVDYYKIVLDTK